MGTLIKLCMAAALAPVVCWLWDWFVDHKPDQTLYRYVPCGGWWSQVVVGPKLDGSRACRMSSPWGDIQFQARTVGIAVRRAQSMTKGDS